MGVMSSLCQLHETVLNMPLVLRVQVLMASSSTSNTSNCLALKNVEGPTCAPTEHVNHSAGTASAIDERWLRVITRRRAQVGRYDDAAAAADAHALHARLKAGDHAVDAQPRLRRPVLWNKWQSVSAARRPQMLRHSAHAPGGTRSR